MRKKPEVLAELIDKDAERATTDESLAIYVDNKLFNGEMIERALDIQMSYKVATGVSLPLHRIRKVMRD